MNIETKYNIGDIVSFVYQYKEYNDCVIDGISVFNDNGILTVYYHHVMYLFREDHVLRVSTPVK